MSISLYTDHQVHKGIVDGLRLRAVDVLTAREDGMDEAPDEQVIARATALGRLLFTNDTDFLRIADEMQIRSEPFSGVAFARHGAGDVGRLVEDLELIAKAMSSAEIANQVTYLPF